LKSLCVARPVREEPRDDDGWLLQRAVYDGDEASVEGRETGKRMAGGGVRNGGGFGGEKK
jgi:hypothetical protein